MPNQIKQNILAGRKRVEAYRIAHLKMHKKPWHKGIPKAHTPLLNAMVNALEGLGFTFNGTNFEIRKTEILAKFWDASDLENIKELGFKDREDFENRTTEEDRETFEGMWR